MPRWTIADMPQQTGRLAVVTGANSGIGYETALALASGGAHVIVAARDEAKGRAAAQAIGRGAEWRPLDLARLASVAAFADRMAADGAAIDLLILNAGVMAPLERRTTADGFEFQLGTNYLGHFALAQRLWPLIAEGGRVVPLSSIAAKRARLHFNDPMFEHRYDAWAAYCQSKLAMLIFARELARRQAENASIAAHPGFARTNIISNGPGDRSLRGRAYRLFAGLYSQSAVAGAMPVLRAATDPSVASGDYIGSVGPFEMTGPPGPVPVPPAARDPVTAERLWALSEEWVSLPFRP